jgi:DNA polymerase Ligase (LigD)
MPRFVILEHDWPHRHWDLMLEAGPILRTWRLAAPLTTGVDVAAQAIGDHRLHYLDYEGPVSGNRGSVVRRDNGTFDWMRDDIQAVAIRLAGTRCRGELEIVAREGIARLRNPLPGP